MLELRKISQDKKVDGKFTYIYFYFGGAGANDGSYYGHCAIFNSEDARAAYPLERRIRTLANVEQNCVVHLFMDCARLKMTLGLKGYEQH